MYAITLQLFAGNGSINTQIYQQLAETYQLPPIESLLVSLEQDISWQHVQPETQVYFLDNLREANRRDLYQIRFKTSPDAHEQTAIFLSLKPEPRRRQVHMLTIQFPSRGDRHCSAKVIGWLKELSRTSGIPIAFELSGYSERSDLRYVREHSLSAFKYHAELKRYLHVTDVPAEVKETKKGMNYYKH